MQPITLDPRLHSAASYVRQGAVFADIGTDHALLPIYLVQQGRVTRALACDITQGPCDRAAANITRHGLSDRIEVIRTDGLAGLDSGGLTDIAVCGMGGELIASIIDAAAFVRTPHIRLILVPMSRAEELRLYLSRSGFEIREEHISEAAGKLYPTLCVHYCGCPYELTETEALLGRFNLTHPTPTFISLAHNRAEALRRRISGLAKAGEDTSHDERLLFDIEEQIHDCQRALQ